MATVVSPSPVPVASYGRDPKVAEAVREKLMPDYDGKFPPPSCLAVLSPLTRAQSGHTCLDITTARPKLPALCSGQLDVVAALGPGHQRGARAGRARGAARRALRRRHRRRRDGAPHQRHPRPRRRHALRARVQARTCSRPAAWARTRTSSPRCTARRSARSCRAERICMQGLHVGSLQDPERIMCMCMQELPCRLAVGIA